MNKLTFLSLLIVFAAFACKKSDNTDTDVAPTNLTLNAVATSDSSGLVDFTATATNAAYFNFNYGDNATEVSKTGVVTHRYSASGIYTVTVVAKSTGGKSSTTKTTLVTVNVVKGLLWADEFDTDGAPDPTKWGFDLGAGGWGNNEVEYYTNRLDNAVVSNGTLKINLKKESYQGSPYTSARLLTHGKFSFTYGKVEVRAKLPAGGGTWPAIWMLGESVFTSGIGWPACGEVDIMEHVGNGPGIIHSSIHTTSSYGATVNTATKTVSTYNTDFHLYQVNWTSNQIQFSIDNVPFYSYSPAVRNASTWPFDNPCFLILNVAMGGNFGGTVDPNFTSGTMEIDYVRVFQ